MPRRFATAFAVMVLPEPEGPESSSTTACRGKLAGHGKRVSVSDGHARALHTVLPAVDVGDACAGVGPDAMHLLLAVQRVVCASLAAGPHVP